jgi:Raf kinase inhibitor-like YbhB/YbcL family protein
MRNRFVNFAAILALAVACSVTIAAQGPPGGARPGGAGGRGGGRGFVLPPLLMETDAFPDGGIVPAKYVSANGGMSVLPGFKISNAPAGTVAYAVILHDVDVALGGPNDVLHWIAWNIPASANGWPEGSLPSGSVQGNNQAGQPSYLGPGAPAGPRYHHYIFELYALNANLDIPQTATRADLLAALQGKTTAKAAYVGRFRAGEAPAPPAGGR